MRPEEEYRGQVKIFKMDMQQMKRICLLTLSVYLSVCLLT